MGAAEYSVFSWHYHQVPDDPEASSPPPPLIQFDGDKPSGTYHIKKSGEHPPNSHSSTSRSQTQVFCNAVLRELHQLNHKPDSQETGKRIRPLKRYYIDTANTLVPLATFAGGITIATQFIIQCPHSRLEALLGMASQLFLATPLALMPIYLLLYGKDDDEPISYATTEWSWCCSQLCVAGLFLSAAFILLGTAIYVAETDDKTIGTYGLALLCLCVCIGVFAAVLTSRCWKWGKGDHVVIWPSVWRGMALFVPQMVVMGLLLGIGGRAASNATVHDGCTAVQA